MKQIGKVIECSGVIAKIECERKSACDMCENASHCNEKCKIVYATALNHINASEGDTVEIETNTFNVLKNAFFVFILPIFTAIISYFAANYFFGENIAVVVTFAVLLFSMVVFSFLLNKSQKTKIVSKIVRILN